jgi:hypothetical protein
VCIFILSIIRWDTSKCQNELNQHGISKFCTGLDLLSSTQSNELLFDFELPTTTEVNEDIQ